MKYGVLGTGIVGMTIASKLVGLGHEVMIGSRTKDNPKTLEWVQGVNGNAKNGTFSDAAQFGDLSFNCIHGQNSLQTMQSLSSELVGKILIDISNPLDFSLGFPPRLSVCNDDSLGEQIQRSLPKTDVVKALNMVTSNLMVNPGLLPIQTDLMVCGNDQKSKEIVINLLKNEFGWKNILDLGDISSSRGMEMYLILWTRLMPITKSPIFNFTFIK